MPAKTSYIFLVSCKFKTFSNIFICDYAGNLSVFKVLMFFLAFPSQLFVILTKCYFDDTCIYIWRENTCCGGASSSKIAIRAIEIIKESSSSIISMVKTSSVITFYM